MESRESLQFGIIPSSIVHELRKHGDWKARADAIEQMEQVVAEQREGMQILPVLAGLLEFLATLQRDTNFKISQSATQMLQTIIGLVGSEIKPHLGIIYDGLVEKLSDQKLSVRQANMKVISKLMHILRPRVVLDRFLSTLTSSATNSRTKEEIVNAVLFALLTFKQDELAFPPIVRALLETIANETGRVRTVAIEAMAVINKLLNSHLGGLLSGAAPPEPVRQLLDRRFQNKSLPYINRDGLVEHCPQAPLETHSHQQKASGFKTESCDSDEDEEQPRGMTSSASNGKPPWDIQVQRARQSAGRRTRGAVEYESPSASADSSTLMMRRMQKHPPSVEVSPSKEPIYGGTADLDGSLLSVKSDLGHAGGFMTPIDRSAMDKAMTPPSIGAMHPAMKHIGTSGPLTPKRTPGSLCYGDRGSSNSSGDSAGPLEECLSPTASLKGLQEPLIPHPPIAGRRRPGEESEARHSRCAGSSGRGISSPGPRGTGKDALESIHPDVRIPEDRFHRSWAPNEVLPNAPDMPDSPSRSKQNTWSHSPAQAPETPSGSRKLAILKRRNQESRSQCRSAAPGLEASESPMYPRNRRPPAGPMSESSPYPEESGAPAMRSWQSAPEVPNRAGMSDGFNSPGCQQAARDGKQDARTPASSLGLRQPVRASARAMPRVSDEDEDAESPAVSSRRAASASTAMEKGRSAVEELETHQLQPVPNPTQAMQKVLDSLTKANKANRKQLDWVAQYDAITDARRLLVHHREVFCGNLHAFVRAALPSVDELRSLTAKNALLMWKEAFQSLGRQLDPEIEHICPVLVRKAGDVSVAGRENFLVELAASALKEMVTCCSETRSAAALVACSSHSSKYVRAKVASALDELLRGSSPPPSSGTTERCFNAAVGFLEEAAPDTRTYGKRMLWAIYNRSPAEFESLLRKLNNDIKASKVRDVVWKGSEPPLPIRVQQSMGTRRGLSPGNSSSASGTPKSVASSPGPGRSTPSSPDFGGHRLQRRSSEGDPPPVHPRLQGRSPSRFQHKNSTGDVEEAQAGTSTSELEMAVADAKRLLDSNDWRERSAALRQLCDIRDQLRLLPDTEISLLLDSITFRLSDGNVKVNLLALETLEAILPSLGSQAALALNTLVPALSANAASTNDKIRGKASDAVDALIRSVDGGLLVQNLSHVVSHGNQRSKAIMIEKLDRVVRECYSRQPRLIGKHALHAALSSLNDSKADIRAANHKLLRSLYAAMGPQLLDVNGLSPDVCQRLAAIVQ